MYALMEFKVLWGKGERADEEITWAITMKYNDYYDKECMMYIV